MMFDALTWGLRTFAVLFGALVAFAIVALATNLPSAFANSAPRTITTSGFAMVPLVPDRIDVAATVSTAATTTAEALDKNNERVAAVLAGLKADGIANKDIRTTGFMITPQHPKGEGYAQNEMITTGYVVTNSIIVTLNATGSSGKVVDRLVRLGANGIDRVNFYAENTAAAQDSARERAAQNARERAERIVKALGNRLGRTVKVEVETPPLQAGYSLYANAAPQWRPENSDTLQLAAPQTQAVTATLSVTFEIE